jgi:hypothetical protein
MTVIDFAAAKEKREKEAEDDDMTIDSEEKALQFAIAIASDIGWVLDDMEIPLEKDPKSMGEIFLLIDVLKALITRVAGIKCDAQQLADTLIDIDYEHHLIEFREIMESDEMY